MLSINDIVFVSRDPVMVVLLVSWSNHVVYLGHVARTEPFRIRGPMFWRSRRFERVSWGFLFLSLSGFVSFDLQRCYWPSLRRPSSRPGPLHLFLLSGPLDFISFCTFSKRKEWPTGSFLSLCQKISCRFPIASCGLETDPQPGVYL